jgi:hypothetical protein
MAGCGGTHDREAPTASDKPFQQPLVNDAVPSSWRPCTTRDYLCAHLDKHIF